jgi:hypothetical protein
MSSGDSFATAGARDLSLLDLIDDIDDIEESDPLE